MAHRINTQLSLEVALATIQAVEAAMDSGADYPFVYGKSERAAVSEAAISIGINHSSMLRRLERCAALYGLIPKGIVAQKHNTGLRGKQKQKPAPIVEAQEPTRSDLRDANFWKNRFNAASKELDRAERMAEQLAGLRQIAPKRIEWALPDASSRGKSVVGLLLSDVHMGEVIALEETSGINAFDEVICRKRLRRFFTAACHVGARLASDTECKGALLALGGDMISGDIHEELRITNALTSQEQIAAAIEEIAAGIRVLVEAFGKVHVVSVPGNHSRTTHKPTAKLYSRASYDTLIAAMLAERFKDSPQITFQFGPDKDQVFNTFGFETLLTHGDKIGTRGGMGFAGPMLPILRGAKKIEAQQASIGRKPDYIWHGHYHTSGNASNILSNGSVPGYSEFGSDIRAMVEPPQQWLVLMHSKWGMRERVPIQLEEPGIAKPRISVRAA
jgi:hypothetical protein